MTVSSSHAGPSAVAVLSGGTVLRGAAMQKKNKAKATVSSAKPPARMYRLGWVAAAAAYLVLNCPPSAADKGHMLGRAACCTVCW